MRFQLERFPMRLLFLLCLALPALLAGCGGGGGGGTSAPPSQFAGEYRGTVTTGNNNVTTPATFFIDANNSVSTTFNLNGVNQSFNGSLGTVDANGNFNTQINAPVNVQFVGTIKPEAGTGVMRIDGTFFIPSTGLRGTYIFRRVAQP